MGAAIVCTTLVLDSLQSSKTPTLIEIWNRSSALNEHHKVPFCRGGPLAVMKTPDETLVYEDAFK